MMKRFLIVVFLVCTGCFATPFFSLGQVPVKQFTTSNFSAEVYKTLQTSVGKSKIIPALYEKQILIALSYFPELADANIEFRIKHVYTPLSSRPSWLSVFRKHSNRLYIITISDSSKEFLAPILLNKMDFNAQVGVLGHELSHVADFSMKHTNGLLRIGFGNLSQSFLDKFEFGTDSICIAHGLGYQLLSWSNFIRKAFHSPNWDGADTADKPVMKQERYMNPETIRGRILQDPLYQNK